MELNIEKSDIENNNKANAWRTLTLENSKPTSGAELQDKSVDSEVNKLGGDFLSERRMLMDNFLDDGEEGETGRLAAFVGINITAEEIVDPRVELSDAEIIEEKRREGVEIAPNQLAQIVERRASEEKKLRDFREYIAGFGGKLKNARVHPYNSPLNPKNAVRTDGSLKIADKFIEQMNFLSDHGVENLDFVMPMLDPNIPADTIAKIIASLASRVNAKNITIELGNETNILPEQLAGESGGTINEISCIDPKMYAETYKKVAEKVKAAHPDVKLGVAGTAFFDPDYLMAVLDGVDDDDLVDQISFHPYRGDTIGATRFVQDSLIAETPKGQATYAEQEDAMKRLAAEHSAELTVGEVQFSKYDPRAHDKLAESMENSAENGVKSFLWPRETLNF